MKPARQFVGWYLIRAPRDITYNGPEIIPAFHANGTVLICFQYPDLQPAAVMLDASQVEFIGELDINPWQKPETHHLGEEGLVCCGQQVTRQLGCVGLPDNARAWRRMPHPPSEDDFPAPNPAKVGQ